MARERPLLAYDKDCGFCRRFISRWQRVVGEKIEFRPSVEAQEQFPGVPLEAFRDSVHLVERDGTVTRAAEAVFRTLSYEKGHGLPRWLYERVAPFRFITERVYAWVARHRALASTLTKPLFPDDPIPVSLTRSLFIRALGVVFLFAFASAEIQVDGLFGSKGIAPATRLFEYVRGNVSFFDLPSIFWLSASDAVLHLVCWIGIAASGLVICGVLPRLLLLLLWALYLSIVHAGDVFMSFQWDLLLIETGSLAVLFAPWGALLRRSSRAPENRGALFLLRLLLFRLMFASGLVKLLSGDPAWRDMTATTFHYWTQPLPNPLSVFMHFQPHWLHRIGCSLMLLIELMVPFFIFAPRKLRLVSFVLLGGLQLLIIATGNYGFFNLLTLALCFTLLDDQVLTKVLPKSLGQPWAPWKPAPAWRTAIAALIVFTLAALGMAELFARAGLHDVVPRPVADVMAKTRPFYSINSYGLFAVMTKSRPEIILEGSDDGTTWKQYVLPFKPETVETRPRFLLGHMPRLDWMMWFASLGSCRSTPWFIQLQDGLLRGATAATRLYMVNPFPTTPPRFLRSTTYQYTFTPPSERGSYWRAELQGPYCPTLTLQNGQLGVARP